MSLCVEKIVLKCLTKKGRFKRQMCIKIFSREEFREKIPSYDIIFNLNTHTSAPDWEITSPFKISTGLKKCSNCQPQKHHWIRSVMRNKINFESSGLSMRKYCAKNKIPFSMFQRRLHLLKSLSEIEGRNFAMLFQKFIRAFQFAKGSATPTIERQNKL